MADLKDGKIWPVIYTQRPVIDAKTLGKNVYYDFPIRFAQFDQLSKNLTERRE